MIFLFVWVSCSIYILKLRQIILFHGKVSSCTAKTVKSFNGKFFCTGHILQALFWCIITFSDNRQTIHDSWPYIWQQRKLQSLARWVLRHQSWKFLAKKNVRINWEMAECRGKSWWIHNNKWICYYKEKELLMSQAKSRLLLPSLK